MTIEEIIEKANKGDIECMILLGDSISKNESIDTAKKFELALPWYEKAAEAGNTNGAYKSMFIHGMYGFAKINIGIWDKAADHFLKAFGYAKQVLSNPDLDVQVEYSSRQNQQVYCYQLAYCHYWMGNTKLAYNLSIKSPEAENYVKAKMLGAICAFDIVAETGADFSVAESLLSIFDTYNLEPVFSTIKDSIEEVVLSRGYIYLSTLYRLKKDTTKAFNVLTSGKNAIHADGARELLENELIHYKPKLFGGYQYVE